MLISCCEYCVWLCFFVCITALIEYVRRRRGAIRMQLRLFDNLLLLQQILYPHGIDYGGSGGGGGGRVATTRCRSTSSRDQRRATHG